MRVFWLRRVLVARDSQGVCAGRGELYRQSIHSCTAESGPRYLLFDIMDTAPDSGAHFPHTAHPEEGAPSEATLHEWREALHSFGAVPLPLLEFWALKQSRNSGLFGRSWSQRHFQLLLDGDLVWGKGASQVTEGRHGLSMKLAQLQLTSIKGKQHCIEVHAPSDASGSAPPEQLVLSLPDASSCVSLLQHVQALQGVLQECHSQHSDEDAASALDEQAAVDATSATAAAIDQPLAKLDIAAGVQDELDSDASPPPEHMHTGHASRSDNNEDELDSDASPPPEHMHTGHAPISSLQKSNSADALDSGTPAAQPDSPPRVGWGGVASAHHTEAHAASAVQSTTEAAAHAHSSTDSDDSGGGGGVSPTNLMQHFAAQQEDRFLAADFHPSNASHEQQEMSSAQQKVHHREVDPDQKSSVHMHTAPANSTPPRRPPQYQPGADRGGSWDPFGTPLQHIATTHSPSPIPPDASEAKHSSLNDDTGALPAPPPSPASVGSTAPRSSFAARLQAIRDGAEKPRADMFKKHKKTGGAVDRQSALNAPAPAPSPPPAASAPPPPPMQALNAQAYAQIAHSPRATIEQAPSFQGTDQLGSSARGAAQRRHQQAATSPAAAPEAYRGDHDSDSSSTAASVSPVSIEHMSHSSPRPVTPSSHKPVPVLPSTGATHHAPADAERTSAPATSPMQPSTPPGGAEQASLHADRPAAGTPPWGLPLHELRLVKRQVAALSASLATFADEARDDIAAHSDSPAEASRGTARQHPRHSVQALPPSLDPDEQRWLQDALAPYIRMPSHPVAQRLVARAQQHGVPLPPSFAQQASETRALHSTVQHTPMRSAADPNGSMASAAGSTYRQELGRARTTHDQANPGSMTHDWPTNSHMGRLPSGSHDEPYASPATARAASAAGGSPHKHQLAPNHEQGQEKHSPFALVSTAPDSPHTGRTLNPSVSISTVIHEHAANLKFVFAWCLHHDLKAHMTPPQPHEAQGACCTLSAIQSALLDSLVLSDTQLHADAARHHWASTGGGSSVARAVASAMGTYAELKHEHIHSTLESIAEQVLPAAAADSQPSHSWAVDFQQAVTVLLLVARWSMTGSSGTQDTDVQQVQPEDGAYLQSLCGSYIAPWVAALRRRGESWTSYGAAAASLGLTGDCAPAPNSASTPQHSHRSRGAAPETPLALTFANMPPVPATPAGASPLGSTWRSDASQYIPPTPYVQEHRSTLEDVDDMGATRMTADTQIVSAPVEDATTAGTVTGSCDPWLCSKPGVFLLLGRNKAPLTVLFEHYSGGNRLMSPPSLLRLLIDFDVVPALVRQGQVMDALLGVLADDAAANGNDAMTESNALRSPLQARYAFQFHAGGAGAPAVRGVASSLAGRGGTASAGLYQNMYNATVGTGYADQDMLIAMHHMLELLPRLALLAFDTPSALARGGLTSTAPLSRNSDQTAESLARLLRQMAGAQGGKRVIWQARGSHLPRFSVFGDAREASARGGPNGIPGGLDYLHGRTTGRKGRPRPNWR